MTSEPASTLPDIQSTCDSRKVAIQRVGVTSVSYPVQFATRGNSQPTQPTIASFDMFVSLPADQRGTHMSRFMQVLRDWQEPFNPQGLREFSESLRSRLDADQAELRVRFPFFVERSAPVTGEAGKLRIDVEYEIKSGDHEDLVLTVTGPATSLCPCSKEISSYGAHNQRCEVKASVRSQPQNELSIEELFEIMERSASTQVFPVLKRPDEKWVTEDAYDHPAFVEDIVRDLALALQSDDRVTWYRCSSENFESIHQHNAFAQIEGGIS